MTKTFKVGDWVYYDFKLHQVMKTEEEQVSEVSDGYFRRSGWFLTCYPLEMTIKNISDSFSFVYDKLYKECKGSMVNIPDIHRHFVAEWEECCENKNDRDFVQNKFNKLEEFCEQVKDKIKSSRDFKVQGVNIFR